MQLGIQRQEIFSGPISKNSLSQRISAGKEEIEFDDNTVAVQMTCTPRQRQFSK